MLSMASAIKNWLKIGVHHGGQMTTYKEGTNKDRKQQPFLQCDIVKLFCRVVDDGRPYLHERYCIGDQL